MIAVRVREHPWFQKNRQSKSIPSDNIPTLKNLVDFRSQYKLQKAVLIYFVNFFDIKEEKKRLLQVFKDLDKDHDGQISHNELIEAYKQFSFNSSLELHVNEIIKKLDFNQTAAIDFGEFLVAHVSYMQSLNQKRLKQIFDIIDRDKNGFLTVEEIKTFLNLADSSHDGFVKTMIAEVDSNKDGVVGYDEFEAMMNQFIKRF